ncbi:hypothetical protein, partial [Marinobacter sp.]|uniref:hypothetical protein n=1 Tax=Marinobacter sp. TaxID=50741 RepID=UPI00199F6785
MDTSDPEKAAVSGEFVFITTTTQEKLASLAAGSADFKSAYVPITDSGSSLVTVLTSASIVDGSQALGLVDYGFEFSTAKSIEGAAILTLKDGVTVVGKIAEFDLNAGGVKASGNGHVWLLIGEEGAPSAEHRALLDIRLEGGNLTFDMPSDDDVLTLEPGTVIDLGGGTLIVSDGKVLAYADQVQLLNIGDVVVNSELVITYDQFMEKSANPDFTVTGTGTVTVLVEDDAQAAAFFDVVAQSPGVLGEDAPVVRLENSSLGVVTEVDFANLVDSKLVFLTASLEQQITDLGDAIAGGDLTESTYTTLLSISNALETLNGAGDSSVAGQIATAIGQPTVGETAATGLWAQIEALASQVVADLEGQITDLGDAIAGGDLTDATYTTLLSISNALETLNGAGDSSVAGQIATAIGQPTVGETAATGLWAQIEALASQVVADLEGQITDLGDAIAGGDLTDATYTTLLSISNALETLNGAGDSSVAGQIATAIGQPTVGETAATGLWAQIEALASQVVADLEGQITDLGDAITGGDLTESTYTTLLSISNALETLNGAGDSSVAGQIATVIGQPTDGETAATGLWAQIEALASQVVADLEGQITDLGDAIAGGDLTESTYTTLLSISNALETLNG